MILHEIASYERLSRGAQTADCGTLKETPVQSIASAEHFSRIEPE
ncbi:hypothetical protein VJ918_00950 [Adlercreutzia sp. R21]|uniref:Resolvase/invertase-type recombinase catalytic domain-containing protein n=1 Tax=Adlercreutzia wanghongyangiae TaxID=3111451 RepID=A0ABU6IGF3_9ACTN|nr:hypothetical protein [Adlercreutzia sp. R21]MEC4175515.1 hypothetical protein [Adlercreutzia sp. R7]MEC4183370.1 hypothetical protein [Adlercreutzia sp. R21]